MNDFWSKQVQSTELLYYSREERFNDENKDFWFDRLKVKNGMKILEIGCGGGHFTNMIKRYFPDCEVYGIDLDENHINFAREKCRELKLDVKYSVADVRSLPFESETFDLVYSHTVVEHVPFDDFIREQWRVLKTGGDLVITRVDMVRKNDKPFTVLEDEIGDLYASLKLEPQATVAKYLEDPDMTMRRLHEYKFRDIDFKYDRVIYYMPDIEQDRTIALKQIERNYRCKLYYALFSLQRATNQKEMRNTLLSTLKRQYEERVRMYLSDEKIFDFQSTLLITITATK